MAPCIVNIFLSFFLSSFLPSFLYRFLHVTSTRPPSFQARGIDMAFTLLAAWGQLLVSVIQKWFPSSEMSSNMWASSLSGGKRVEEGEECQGKDEVESNPPLPPPTPPPCCCARVSRRIRHQHGGGGAKGLILLAPPPPCWQRDAERLQPLECTLNKYTIKYSA